MKTSAEFWRDLELDPPHNKVLRAEKHDLTRNQINMIAKVGVYDRIINSLSSSGRKLFLAGMYLQGSLTSEARESYFELIDEIEKRELDAKLSETPQRKGKSDARVQRGL